MIGNILVGLVALIHRYIVYLEMVRGIRRAATRRSA